MFLSYLQIDKHRQVFTMIFVITFCDKGLIICKLLIFIRLYSFIKRIKRYFCLFLNFHIP